jgi:8-oxo-dGTP pyrophosphatase MutT (NUDIX family)
LSQPLSARHELEHRLAGVLLEPAHAVTLEVHGDTDAAVLVPLYVGADDRVHGVFTRRRDDMRRHPGEVSFPGGRREDDDPQLVDTALREAHEEIGLPADAVTIVGALEPTPTMVTGYRVYPFVGVIEPGHVWDPAAAEVAEVLELSLNDLRDGFAIRPISRRGTTFQTETYVVGDNLIWGATARILQNLLVRLSGAPPAAPQ